MFRQILQLAPVAPKTLHNLSSKSFGSSFTKNSLRLRPLAYPMSSSMFIRNNGRNFSSKGSSNDDDLEASARILHAMNTMDDDTTTDAEGGSSSNSGSTSSDESDFLDAGDNAFSRQ